MSLAFDEYGRPFIIIRVGLRPVVACFLHDLDCFERQQQAPFVVGQTGALQAPCDHPFPVCVCRSKAASPACAGLKQ